MPLTRRTLLASSASTLMAAELKPQSTRLKITVTGGHPGDPECGCAGTIARLADLGHAVTLLYMNRGEGYCKGHPANDCGAVRTAEAQKACAILNARPAFVGQIDGQAVVDNAHYGAVEHLLEAESPDVLFAQWPIDRHRDHRALSSMVLDAWMRGGKKQAFYFYEVADDTMMFTPGDYVDVSGVEARRRAACYAHASQDPDKWYPGQAQLMAVRGLQSGSAQAEGFLRHWESKGIALP